MKELFPGYYPPSEDDFRRIWSECTFVLDANVLLNIYRYPATPRTQLLEVLDRIKERLWVPYHAALEYQRNRVAVIADQKRKFSEVKKAIANALNSLDADFGNMKLRDRHALIDPDVFIGGVRSVAEDFVKQLDKLENEQGDVEEKHPLRDQIERLIANRVGGAPTQEEIDRISRDAKSRFEAKIPPGFMDVGKADASDSVFSYGGVRYEARLGDLIVWEQILAYAKDYGVHSIVFITDDKKEDWWWSVEALGRKILGPRPELVDEIRRKSNVDLFYMYTSDRFLQYAADFLDVPVDEDSIALVRQFAGQQSSPQSMEEDGYPIISMVRNWYIAGNPSYRQVWDFFIYPDLILEDSETSERVGVEIIDLEDSPGLDMTIERRAHEVRENFGPANLSRAEIVVVTRSALTRDIQEALVSTANKLPDKFALSLVGYDPKDPNLSLAVLLTLPAKI